MGFSSSLGTYTISIQLADGCYARSLAGLYGWRTARLHTSAYNESSQLRSHSSDRFQKCIKVHNGLFITNNFFSPKFTWKICKNRYTYVLNITWVSRDKYTFIPWNLSNCIFSLVVSINFPIYHWKIMHSIELQTIFHEF